MKAFFVTVLLHVWFAELSAAKIELSDLIPLCKGNDPQINDCVKKAAQQLIPIIAKGVPLLKVDPLDPMHSPEVRLSEDDDNIKVDIFYTNVVQTGLAQTVVDDVTIDLKNGLMIFNFTLPVFTFSGEYTANGHILNFKMVGSGKSNITLENMKCALIIRFHVEDDKIQEDAVDFEYNFDHVYLNYDHLMFDGDEELGKSTVAFINENAKEIMNGFKPSLNRYYGTLMRSYLKGFFNFIPYSALFNED